MNPSGALRNRAGATDCVQSLLGRGRARAEAEGLAVALQAADAEALPFADASFDAAVSTLGVMIAPDQVCAAAEMLRVLRPGGCIGLASWTPDSFISEMFRVIGQHLPPPAGTPSPSHWGDRPWLEATVGAQAASIAVETRNFVFLSPSAQDWLDGMRRAGGHGAAEGDTPTALRPKTEGGTPTPKGPSQRKRTAEGSGPDTSPAVEIPKGVPPPYVTEIVSGAHLGSLYDLFERSTREHRARGVVVRAGDGYDLKRSVIVMMDHIRVDGLRKLLGQSHPKLAEDFEGCLAYRHQVSEQRDSPCPTCRKPPVPRWRASRRWRRTAAKDNEALYLLSGDGGMLGSAVATERMG